jgi:hypothetical protein
MTDPEIINYSWCRLLESAPKKDTLPTNSVRYNKRYSINIFGDIYDHNNKKYQVSHWSDELDCTVISLYDNGVRITKTRGQWKEEYRSLGGTGKTLKRGGESD